ncbi:thioesterase family protein [Streptomyces abyssomicinicus]|uniref:thioesterase family protein n=1 Tax=Streptomyces abyssomicinicus TaxID=574929 RepID=UPI003F77120D
MLSFRSARRGAGAPKPNRGTRPSACRRRPRCHRRSIGSGRGTGPRPGGGGGRFPRWPGAWQPGPSADPAAGDRADAHDPQLDGPVLPRRLDRTVGPAHGSGHPAPTPVGEDVTLSATLTGVDGRKPVFEVEARNAEAVVLRGRHTRALIDRERFVGRLTRRTG